MALARRHPAARGADGHADSLMAEKLKTSGQVAYEAYVDSCGGKSVRGEDLPSWDGQDPAIRVHWEAAAQAAIETLLNPQ